MERGILGPPNVEGATQQARHLNRIVSWTPQGIEWESDPRHADIVVKTLGVTKPVNSPLLKEKLSDLKDSAEDDPEPLPEDDVKVYQSLTMRLGYVSQDRPDLQRAVRELAKGMCRPNERFMTMLKRAARYLIHAPRCVQVIPFQRRITKITTFCDTDHAGCIRTRKSTTGAVVTIGDATLRSVCRGQSVIALSSGESEFYGLVTAVSESLGDQSVAFDLGVRLNLDIQMDATAGAAIGSRRGLGRVKHIDTCFLWVQDLITNGKVKVHKVHTTENFSDILTKPVSGHTLRALVERMGYSFRKGRSKLALAA